MEESKKDRKRRKVPRWRRRNLPKEVQGTPEFSVDRVTKVVAIYYEQVGNQSLVAADVKWDGGDDIKKVLIEGTTVMQIIFDLIKKRIPFGVPEYGPGVSAPDPDDPSEAWRKS